jgi:hypothetical protein
MSQRPALSNADSGTHALHCQSALIMSPDLFLLCEAFLWLSFLISHLLLNSLHNLASVPGNSSQNTPEFQKRVHKFKCSQGPRK